MVLIQAIPTESRRKCCRNDCSTNYKMCPLGLTGTASATLFIGGLDKELKETMTFGRYPNKKIHPVLVKTESSIKLST